MGLVMRADAVDFGAPVGVALFGLDCRAGSPDPAAVARATCPCSPAESAARLTALHDSIRRGRETPPYNGRNSGGEALAP
jgi:hypothetical protein